MADPTTSPKTPKHPKTELLLLRHGETEWNAQGRLQGHRDSALRPEGVRQADALGARLVHEGVHALYSSDLGRALETARRIGSRIGLEVRADARLRERGLGVLEGLTWEEVRRQHPDVVAAYEAGDPEYVVPGGGESLVGRLGVALEGLKAMAARHPGERVAVVTHGGVLSLLLRHCLGIPFQTPRAFSVLNASLNRFDLQGGTLRLVTWGDVSHLRTLARDDT
jgi:probable phosphoglycerate mutase